LSKTVIFNGNEPQLDFQRIAFLHKQAITGGFLASLHPKILIQLYRTMAMSQHSILWVAKDDKDEIQGFIAISFSTSKLYREFLLKKSLLVLPYLITKIVSIEFVRKIYEVLVYPVKTVSVPMPETEILNFCVDEALRGKNIGSQLFSKVEEELRSRGISNLKIVTGENQKGAQNFYEKRGACLLAKQVIHKGATSYIYKYSIK